MALQKQNIEFPFVGGLDGSVDSRLLPPGRLSTLQNGSINATGVVQRREGFATLGATVYSGEDFSTGNEGVRFHAYEGQYIAESKKGLMASFAGTKFKDLDVYVSDTVTRFHRRTNRASLETEFVAPGSVSRASQAKDLDCAYSGSATHLTCFAWRDAGTSDCHFLVRDENTKQVLQKGQLLLPSAGTLVSIPRVVYVSSASAFYVYYFNETIPVIERIKITVAAPTVFTGPDSLSTAVLGPAASSAWDITYESSLDRLLVSFEDSGNDLQMVRLDPVDGITEITHSAVVASADIKALANLIVSSGGTTYYVTAWCDSAANNIYVSSWANATNLAAPTTTTQAVGHTPGTIDICVNNALPSQYYVIYEQKTFNPNMHIEAFLVTASTVAIASGPRDIVGGCRLLTRAWPSASGEGRLYLGVQFANAIQRSAFIIDVNSMYEANLSVTSFATNAGINPPVLARLFPEAMGAIPGDARRRLCKPLQLDSTNHARQFTIPCIARKELELANSVEYADNYIALAHLDFDGKINYSNLGPGQYLHGACPLFFDGKDLVEAEFNTYPVILSAADSGTGAGLTINTQYSFKLVYEWQDASGRLHRSIPSEATTFTTGGASTGVKVSFYDQLLTRRTFVRICLYRTKASGVVYYHDPAATWDSGGMYTQSSDANLGELLYTEGGSLPHAPSADYGQGCVHQGRVFKILPDRKTIAYSDLDRKDQAPNFSEDLQITVNGDQGKLTALFSADDRLFIFAERGIYIIGGQGAADTGLGATYSDPVLVERHLGCKETCGNSLIADEEGIWFQSSEGLRHLNRGLSISRGQGGQPYGSELGTTPANIVATVNPPGKNEIHFFDGDNRWVYNTRFRQWAKYTDSEACGAAISSSGTVVYMDYLSCDVFEQQSGLTIDAGSSTYSMTVTTGWFKATGLQDYMRVYRIFLLGDATADPTAKAQTLNVYLYTDYNASTVVASKSEAFANLPTSGIIELDIHVPVQKAQAFQVKIQDSSGVGSQLNYKLVGIKFEVGIKQGGPKLPIAQRL